MERYMGQNQNGLFNNQLLLISYMPIHTAENHDVSSWNMPSRNC